MRDRPFFATNADDERLTLHARDSVHASMDVDPDKEAIFNEVYDTEHVPYLFKVPGEATNRYLDLSVIKYFVRMVPRLAAQRNTISFESALKRKAGALCLRVSGGDLRSSGQRPQMLVVGGQQPNCRPSILLGQHDRNHALGDGGVRWVW
jgi:hypothetical protein